MTLGEFDLIRRYFKPLAAGFPGALELGDDAALLAVEAGEQLVVTTDVVVEGVHFLPGDPPADIAAKLLRVNLSDLAAMGAVPLAYTLNTAFPAWIDEPWLAAFAGGLAEDQRAYGIHLAGGDTVSTPGPLTLGVCAFGRVATGRALRRSAAKAGDEIYVSGTIGDAALGLAVLRNAISGDADGFLVERYRRPRPRTTLGPRLVGLARAAIDVSDGLVADLGHVCEESGMSAVLRAAEVPLSDAARAVVAANPGMLTTVLTGGDDYELLFTAPAGAAASLTALAAELGIPLARVGAIVGPGNPPSVSVVDGGGCALNLDSAGFRHF